MQLIEIPHFHFFRCYSPQFESLYHKKQLYKNIFCGVAHPDLKVFYLARLILIGFCRASNTSTISTLFFLPLTQ